MKWAFYLLVAGTVGSGVMALAATAPSAAETVPATVGAAR